jgi:hypothetical protein
MRPAYSATLEGRLLDPIGGIFKTVSRGAARSPEVTIESANPGKAASMYECVVCRVADRVDDVLSAPART